MPICQFLGDLNLARSLRGAKRASKRSQREKDNLLAKRCLGIAEILERRTGKGRMRG